VNENEELCGVVTISDVEAAMAKGNPEGLTVADIASTSLRVAYPDQYLHDVLVKFGIDPVGRVPVVDRSNPKHLLGVLRRHDIIGAYTKAIKRHPR